MTTRIPPEPTFSPPEIPVASKPPVGLLYKSALRPVRTDTPRSLLSFNCSKAQTRSEKLLCQDNDAASADLEMAGVHDQVQRALSGSARAEFVRQHTAWFDTYSNTCNADTNSPAELKTCVISQLSTRTAQLRRLLAN